VDLQAKGESEVGGSITSHLPVALENVSLLYRNKVYQLGTLKPGAENRRVVTASIAFSDWARQNPAVPAPQNVQPRTPWAPKPLPPAIERTGNIIRTIMFHEAFESGGSRTARNAGFRDLDQSWRIGAEDRDGAVLYGQLPMVSGAAEDVVKRNTTATRLWLGALPGSGQQRPPMQGTLRQETHLRFFVPVKAEKK
jgi:hypothetical protein